MIGRALWCLMLAGCGRLGFDILDPNADASGVSIDGGLVCPPGAIFCDDFESGGLSKWTRVGTALSGTASVTNTRAHTGSFALEADAPVQTMDMAQGMAILGYGTQSSGTISTRFWMNLGVPMTNFDLVVELDTLTPSFEYMAVGGDATATWVGTDFFDGTHAGNFPTVAAGPAVDTWTCVELDYAFANGPTSAHVQLFVNETSVLDADSHSNTGVFSELSIGIPRADHGGFHVFIDDVVLASDRIGCN